MSHFLSEELSLASHDGIMKQFNCEKCSQSFETTKDLKEHMRLKHGLVSMREKIQLFAIDEERHLADFKVSLLAKISKMKELELLRKHSCYCKLYCRIHHRKHNFIKSKAEEFG